MILIFSFSFSPDFRVQVLSILFPSHPSGFCYVCAVLDKLKLENIRVNCYAEEKHLIGVETSKQRRDKQLCVASIPLETKIKHDKKSDYT